MNEALQRQIEAPAPQVDGGSLRDQPSPVRQLQRRFGNSALAGMAPVQRRASVPDWIRSQIGVSEADESNLERLETAHQAAETETATPSNGQPLDTGVKQHAEQHLGVKLDDVRVAHGADASCDAMGAQAYATPGSTGGHDVCLSSSVDLNSRDGQFTLMHELAHVAQQKRGETSGLTGIGGDESHRDSLEGSADAHAEKMVSPC